MDFDMIIFHSKFIILNSKFISRIWNAGITSANSHMNSLSSLDRQQLLAQLKEGPFDVLVIGGGITGAGIALDASARGMRVALIEKHDFASGTSSRSTKLIHGGLRYLKQFEIALVREVGRERAVVHRLAPHLVVAEKMLLPIVEGGTFGKFLTSFGLMVYDVLAGVESEDQRVMLSKEKTLEEEPLLDATILRGSGLYAEYRTDDARLTIEVIKTAAQHGALSASYMEGTEFLYNKKGNVRGMRCLDRLSGESLDIKAKYVVSAAGPWVDTLRQKDGSLSGKRLHLTKGVHIVVPHDKFPVRHSIYFDVPDGRMIFAIPRGKVTYIGTTDTDYHDSLDHILTNLEDVNYLLEAVNHFFPDIHLEVADVVSSWAGLRPLIHEDGKSASELSRKDELFVSPQRLISIAGGKLTGYRKMSEKVVDLVAKKMRKKGKEVGPCTTKNLVLTGGDFDSEEAISTFKQKISSQLKPLGLGDYEAGYLIANYGTQVTQLISHVHTLSGNDTQLNLLRAELWFCIHQEAVHGAVDFFSRRTGRLYFDIEKVKKYGPTIVDEMGTVLQWAPAHLAAEQASLAQAIQEAQTFPEGKKF